MENEDYVIKRDGRKEVVSFDKILTRIKNLGDDSMEVNYTALCVKIIERLYNEIPTKKIDELTAQQCASLCTTHPDYGLLASKILVSNHQKNTDSDFKNVIELAHNYIDVHGEKHPLVSNDLYDTVMKNAEEIQSWIDYERDFLLDYFGFKTLERAYLIKINGKIIERPQHMWMRVSLGIHGNDLISARETYDFMSKKFFTHATPTLFNAGTPRPQLSSCYLLSMESDSIKGIYSTLSDCAAISKWAGGIGLHIHNIRSKQSHIRGTNGTSNGIVPMLRVFNTTARYVDQGGGKRAGSFAIYLEPWHADIVEFLDMKKNHGDEEARARDLFYALWIPDLFMKRVKQNGDWTLMCPDKCRGLSDVYGEEFEQLYEKYEKEGKGNITVKAREIWFKILDSQIETGTPYMLYKDSCNKKSNQKNIGTIKSSNLCCEIIEYSDDKETAVCNLASISLRKFVVDTPSPFKGKLKVYYKDDCKWCDLLKALLKRKQLEFTTEKIDESSFEEFKKNTGATTLPQLYEDEDRIGGFTDTLNLLRSTYDYDELHRITKIVTKNLNKVIDINFYPTEKTRTSNLRNRPIGIGVQGLADTFALMDVPFYSDEAKQINKNIFETIYHAALESSMEMSKERAEGMKKLHELWRNKRFQFFEEYYHSHLHEKIRTKNHKYYHICGEEVNDLLNKHKPMYNEFILKTMNNLSGAYQTFNGSPASDGILQFDMWGTEPTNRYNWNELKENIKQHGLRNSLLVAPMPTASTSQILGNNECFEPFTSNIYVRRTLAGEFIVVNKYLMEELIALNLWNEDLKNRIISENGSIQNIPNIPKFIKEKYRTVWEIPMKHIIQMSSERGPYICQSQSLNLWMKDPTYDKLTAMHFYAWSQGLKTGIYYLRTKAKAAPQQFTIEPENKKEEELDEDDEDCLMCGS